MSRHIRCINFLWAPFVLDILNLDRCPKNLYNLKDVLSARTISYNTESTNITKSKLIGCPHGMFWCLPSLTNTPQTRPTSKTRKQMETSTTQTIEIVGNWGRKYNMQFEPNRSKFMLLGTKSKKSPPITKMGSKTLWNVKSLRILGVIFDPLLSFLPHLDHIKWKY